MFLGLDNFLTICIFINERKQSLSHFITDFGNFCRENSNKIRITREKTLRKYTVIMALN